MHSSHSLDAEAVAGHGAAVLPTFLGSIAKGIMLTAGDEPA